MTGWLSPTTVLHLKEGAMSPPPGPTGSSSPKKGRVLSLASEASADSRHHPPDTGSLGSNTHQAHLCHRLLSSPPQINHQLTPCQATRPLEKQ